MGLSMMQEIYSTTIAKMFDLLGFSSLKPTSPTHPSSPPQKTKTKRTKKPGTVTRMMNFLKHKWMRQEIYSEKNIKIKSFDMD